MFSPMPFAAYKALYRGGGGVRPLQILFIAYRIALRTQMVDGISSAN
jgi:hypothetical protein